jgi:hypothetical protein
LRITASRCAKCEWGGVGAPIPPSESAFTEQFQRGTRGRIVGFLADERGAADGAVEDIVDVTSSNKTVESIDN